MGQSQGREFTNERSYMVYNEHPELWFLVQASTGSKAHRPRRIKVPAVYGHPFKWAGNNMNYLQPASLQATAWTACNPHYGQQHQQNSQNSACILPLLDS